MILAAGLGTRLSPYTDRYPKPLLPLFDVPLIEYGVRRVVEAGIQCIVVNTHHQCELLESFLRDLGERLPERPTIHISREPELLGTGGGLAKARPFFDGKTLLVVNSDLFFDFDLGRLARLHRDSGAAATALLHEGTGFDRLRSTLVNEAGQITWIGPSRSEDPQRRVFAGVYLLEPEAYQPLRPEPSSVITGAFRPLMESGRPVMGLVEDFLWRDLGTWGAYWRFCQEVLNAGTDSGLFGRVVGSTPGRFISAGTVRGPATGPAYIGPEVTIDPGATVGPGSVLHHAANLGPHHISHTVALPGSRIAADVERAIVGPTFQIPLTVA